MKMAIELAETKPRIKLKNEQKQTYLTKKLNFYTVMFNLLPACRLYNNLLPKSE